MGDNGFKSYSEYPDNVSEEQYYDEYSEDRDIVLEYNQVKFDDVNVVNILGTGIDNLTRTQAVAKVINMIKEKGVHHIVSMNPYRIMKTRSATDLSVLINKTDMHLAGGGGLLWAARRLKKPIKELIPILSFMMDIVRIAEIKEYTIFMVGSKPEIIEMAFANIRKSFPRIRIIGHHGGNFNKEREKSIIEAMRKSEPDIIFIGLGFPKEDRWIQKIKKEFHKGVFISVGGSIDIMSGVIKKAPAWFVERNIDWFYRILIKPWRVSRIMRTMFFFVRIWFMGLRKR